MMDKIHVAVLFGGASSEHEISLISATSVLSHLDPERYQVTMVGITRQGEWLLYEGAAEDIVSAAWEKETNTFGRVLPNPSRDARSFCILYPDGRTENRRIDVVFPVLHGSFGEDGTVQGMMAVCGIPTVGCGCFSSALCMDKAMTKSVLNQAGVLQARAVILKKSGDWPLRETTKARIAALGYPCFVKPSRAGSSVGISKVKSPDDLEEALRIAFAEDTKVLVEEMIVGQEIEVAVLEEKGKFTVSEPAEIVPGAEFYDYDAKYNSDCARFYIPARLSGETSEKVRRLAEEIFRHLDCSGLSRVDFFVTEDQKVVFNEINTIPGFTSISMYPKLMTRQSMDYSELVDRLIRAAL